MVQGLIHVDLLFATKTRASLSSSIGYHAKGSICPLPVRSISGCLRALSRSSRTISFRPRLLFGLRRALPTSVMASRRMRCCVFSSLRSSGCLRFTKLKLGFDNSSMVEREDAALDCTLVLIQRALDICFCAPRPDRAVLILSVFDVSSNRGDLSTSGVGRG